MKCAELVVVLLVGCSSAATPTPLPDGGGGAESDGPVVAADGARPADAPARAADAAPADLSFCDPYAAKICDRISACLPNYVDIVYGGMATCQERFRLGCRIEGTLVGTGWRKDTTDACTAALGTASCDDVIAGSVLACEVSGLVPIGGACGAGAQCTSGFCRTPETSFCGQCAARAAEGAECDANEACAPGLLCSDAGRCVKPSAVGAFCNETRPCQPGVAYCSDADNTCQRYGAEGKSCNNAGATFFQPCNWGLACRPQGGGTCTKIRYVAAGQSCGIPSSPGGLPVLCLGSASCISGMCRAPGADDAACTPSPLGDASGCLAPALCLAGRCKLPDPAGCK